MSFIDAFNSLRDAMKHVECSEGIHLVIEARGLDGPKIKLALKKEIEELCGVSPENLDTFQMLGTKITIKEQQ